MFEKYFIKPQTVDRFRASWIGAEVEDYVGWLAEHGYGAKTVWRRVPLLVAFGEFASERGARAIGELPGHVDAFVASRVAEHHDIPRGSRPDRPMSKEIRGPIEQMLSVVLPGFEPSGRREVHGSRRLRCATRVFALRASAGCCSERLERHRRVASDLSALEHSEIDLVGRRQPGARWC